MFNHRFRYLLIIALGTYSYLNAVYAEVFALYAIKAPWYLCLATMLLMTFAVWEGNRLIAPFLEKQLPGKDTWVKLILSFSVGTVFAVFSAFFLPYNFHSITWVNVSFNAWRNTGIKACFC